MVLLCDTQYSSVPITHRSIEFFRGVAQPGSALAWGVRCRRFKSSRPDHFSLIPTVPFRTTRNFDTVFLTHLHIPVAPPLLFLR